VTFPEAYVLLIPRAGGWTMSCHAEPCWTEHQVRYGYPPEVISQAEHTASAVLVAVTSGAEPFWQVCRAWLAKVPRS